MAATHIYIQHFVFNPFQENTYVIYNLHNEAIMIDPGCGNREEQKQLGAFIKQNNLRIIHLINTHGHIDHILGNHFIKTTYQVQLAIHPFDVPLLEKGAHYAQAYGIGSHYEPCTPNLLCKEGETIKIKGCSLKILHVPGHSPGHIALYSEVMQICFGGDILFKGSIGRTDLPGGDKTTLLQSIQNKILPLGDEITIYPGHGSTTTIGNEKRNNPFINSLPTL